MPASKPKLSMRDRFAARLSGLGLGRGRLESSNASSTTHLPPCQLQDEGRGTKIARRRGSDRRIGGDQKYLGRSKRETIDRRGILSDRRP